MAFRLLLLICLSFISLGIFAQESLYEFDTKKQEDSFSKLSTELRCPKCQNQNLHDSNSEIADIMRDVIAEELLAGKTEVEIKDLMVDRYGDFVLYKPPVNLETLVLWWAPVGLVAVVFICFLVIVIRRSKYAVDDDEEEGGIDPLSIGSEEDAADKQVKNENQDNKLEPDKD